MQRWWRGCGEPICVAEFLGYQRPTGSGRVFRPDADGFRQSLGDGFAERLLLDGPALVPGDLNHHQVVAAMDAEIIRIEQKMRGVVLADDLETIVLWDVDADEGFLDDTADLLPVSDVLTHLENRCERGATWCLSGAASRVALGFIRARIDIQIGSLEVARRSEEITHASSRDNVATHVE